MLAAREPMLYLGRALISAFVMAFLSFSTSNHSSFCNRPYSSSS